MRIDSYGFYNLVRLKKFVGAELSGLFYFRILNNGAIEFAKEDANLNHYPHAVIQFYDKDQINQNKRLWYIRDDVFQENVEFIRFFEKINFDVLLIKAAMGMWDAFDPARENVVNVIKKTLSRANKLNATIISDAMWKAEFRAENNHQRPIWAQSPKTVKAKFKFGYSNEGQLIYYGSGQDLIDETTHPEMVINYKGENLDHKVLESFRRQDRNVDLIKIENKNLYYLYVHPNSYSDKLIVFLGEKREIAAQLVYSFLQRDVDLNAITYSELQTYINNIKMAGGDRLDNGLIEIFSQNLIQENLKIEQSSNFGGIDFNSESLNVITIGKRIKFPKWIPTKFSKFKTKKTLPSISRIIPISSAALRIKLGLGNPLGVVSP